MATRVTEIILLVVVTSIHCAVSRFGTELNVTNDDVRQFVIVTSIDEIGVPNDDMRSAYKYGCIRKICEKISEILDIDLPHVIPVSNYFAEVAPTTAKNAMSLMNMWRVCNSSKEFILRKRKQTSANFIT